jgi:hypothetical protein
MTAPGPGNEEMRYWEGSHYELVVVRDGVPVMYKCAGSPRDREEAALVLRIRELTGYTVTFGAWSYHDTPNPYDQESEVPLTVVPTG